MLRLVWPPVCRGALLVDCFTPGRAPTPSCLIGPPHEHMQGHRITRLIWPPVRRGALLVDCFTPGQGAPTPSCFTGSLERAAPGVQARRGQRGERHDGAGRPARRRQRGRRLGRRAVQAVRGQQRRGVRRQRDRLRGRPRLHAAHGARKLLLLPSTRKPRCAAVMAPVRMPYWCMLTCHEHRTLAMCCPAFCQD